MTSGAWLEIVAAAATLLGAFLFLASAVGLLRLPDFYTRIHAPTKAATLGVALLALASLVRSLPSGDLVWIEDLLIVVFLLLTVPVSSQVLLRAAATRDAGNLRNTLEVSTAKYFAAEAAVHAANTAMKVFGSYGFSNEYPAARLLRDAKSFQIVEGTSNIQKMIIARQVLDEY